MVGAFGVGWLEGVEGDELRIGARGACAGNPDAGAHRLGGLEGLAVGFERVRPNHFEGRLRAPSRFRGRQHVIKIRPDEEFVNR